MRFFSDFLILILLAVFILSEKTPAFMPEMKRILSEDQRIMAFRQWESIVGSAFFGRPSNGVQNKRPNIIVIMTDDQRWDSIDQMPAVKNRLASEGITFLNSFVTTPLCCPSRASFLTGLYAHNHKVWLNKAPWGGWRKFNEDKEASTLAVWLKEAGYATSLVGKYLNEYDAKTLFIPSGWDDWHANEGGYFNYWLNENGTLNWFGGNDEDYSTDVLKERALAFIKGAKQPFFLLFTPSAPHAKVKAHTLGRIELENAVPAPRHAKGCEEISLPRRAPSFMESDVSDKPSWIQLRRLRDSAEVDGFARSQACALKAVDEAVASFIDALGPQLDNSVIIFTSDNGLTLGEHRLFDSKECIYEECIRVPLIVRYPKLIKSGTTSDEIVLNIDLAPTIAQIANAATSGVDGKSILSLFKGEASGWREEFFGELFWRRSQGNNHFTYFARNKRYKYVQLATGEREFYDLSRDPYELENKINEPFLKEAISAMSDRLLNFHEENNLN